MCEKATKVRLTTLSINSIDMKMVMMFRLIRKLAAPTEKSTAARIRYQEMGTVMSVISPPFLGRNAENDADKGTDKSSEYGHEVIHLDVHYCSFRARTTAPRMAMRIRMLVTSKG